MVVQHEEQHDETMYATLQLRQGPPVLVERRPLPSGRRVEPERAFVPGGPFTLGVDASAEPFSLDNERPAHTVEVTGFWLARLPVSNRQWQEFIADDGYHRQELWSARGWAHRTQVVLERPLFWTEGGTRRRFGIDEDVPPDEPVQHVCYFEAEAFARWPAHGCRPSWNGKRPAPGTQSRRPGAPGRGVPRGPPPTWLTLAAPRCGLRRSARSRRARRRMASSR